MDSVMVFQGVSTKFDKKPILSSSNEKIQEIAPTHYGIENPYLLAKKEQVELPGNACSTTAKFPDKGNAVVTVDGSVRLSEIGAPTSQQLPIPQNWNTSLKAHVEFNEERRRPSFNPQLQPPPAEVAGCQNEVDPPRQPRRRRPNLHQPTNCIWCKKVFVNQFSMAAHSRFCRVKKARMEMIEDRVRPAAVGRDFDLNLLPQEASSMPP